MNVIALIYYLVALSVFLGNSEAKAPLRLKTCYKQLFLTRRAIELHPHTYIYLQNKTIASKYFKIIPCFLLIVNKIKQKFYFFISINMFLLLIITSKCLCCFNLISIITENVNYYKLLSFVSCCKIINN